MNLKKELEETKHEIEEIRQESIAYQILVDYKKANKRQFVIIVFLLVMLFSVSGYLAYVLNDIEKVNVTQDNENGYNSFIGNDGDINYGETDDKLH